MAKERLRRRIAEALAGPSVRDELQRILREDASRPAATGAVDPLPAILDNVKDPIVTVSRDGIVLGANAAAARVLAATVDNVVGRALSEFIPQLAPAGPALDALADRVGDTFVDVTPALIEARRSDGHPLTVEVSVSRAGLGLDGYFVVCMSYVTERLLDEQALREREARYRALV